MNFLRADLYRLRASGVLLGIVLYLLGIVAVLTVVGYVSCLQSGLPPSTWSMGHSFVDMTANMGHLGGLLPLASGYASVYLVASDWKTRGFKSLLATGHARRDYVLSKVAVSAIVAVMAPVILLAGFALLPLVFGIPYETVPAPVPTLLWLGEAALVCFGYAALGVLMSLAVGNETMAYLLVMFLGLGAFGSLLLQLLGLASALVPTAADVFDAMINGLLYTQQRHLGMGLDALALPVAETLRIVFVPLAWAAASLVLGLLAFRRRSL